MAVAISNSILCFSLPNISPHSKFHSNRMKNAEVENFCYWSVLVGRSGRSKNDRSHFKLILFCFLPNISPHTKFNSNRMKNIEVENFHYWSVLVGLVGRKMTVAIANSFYVVFYPILAPIPNFIQIR